jgi:hypothetical protein
MDVVFMFLEANVKGQIARLSTATVPLGCDEAADSNTHSHRTNCSVNT